MAAQDQQTPAIPGFSAAFARRYSREVALRHERLYGPGYQGPASIDVFDALTARIDWRDGMRVVDVGCGLGGDCLRLAARFDIDVLGIDASPDMVDIARERLPATPEARVEFRVGDARDTELLTPDTFDLVWTRDTGAFLRAGEKRLVWRRLFGSTRSGAQVLVTDYCTGSRTPSPAFAARMQEWDQHMITFDDYADLVASVGFVDVQIDDRTEDLLASQRDGLTMLGAESRLTAEIGADGTNSLRERWQEKIGFSSGGDLTWLVLTARKP